MQRIFFDISAGKANPLLRYFMDSDKCRKLWKKVMKKIFLKNIGARQHMNEHVTLRIRRITVRCDA